jgi:hypothetical protein
MAEHPVQQALLVQAEQLVHQAERFAQQTAALPAEYTEPSRLKAALKEK